MLILLTGGAGYIGSHTAVELINSGYEIIIADNLSNSKISVLDRIKEITGVKPKFYEIDVSDKDKVDKMFSENNISAIIHFAGYKAVGESVAEPVKYYRNNIDTILTLLETIDRYNCKQFIFSSSATVYGDPDSLPITETMPVGDCQNPYGKTKYFIEEILKDKAKTNPELSIILLRYFNPVGAHESGKIGESPSGIPNNLMPYITQTALGIREKLSVFGNDYDTHDGTGVRDYIHVTDLAKGHLSSLKFADKHQGVEAINLGTGKGYSVLEIVSTFEKVNNIKVPYIITERRPGDIAKCYANVDKARNLLAWKAEKTLEDMCRDSWKWQQNMD